MNLRFLVNTRGTTSRMRSNNKLKLQTQVKAYTLRPVRFYFVSYVITFSQNSDLKSQYIHKLYLSSRQFDVYSDVRMLIFDRRGNL